MHFRFRFKPKAIGAVFTLGCCACGAASDPTLASSDASSSGGTAGLSGSAATKTFGGTFGTGGTSHATGGETAARASAPITITETLLVEDADDADELNNLSGKWISYDDRLDGGTSKVTPPAWIEGVPLTMSAPGCAGSGYAVHVNGTTGNKLGYDYVGLVMALGPHSYCPDPEPPDVTLAQYMGIRFQAKAARTNGGSISLVVAHRKEGAADNCSNGVIGNTLTQWADYQVDLTSSIGEDWTQVTVEFRNELLQPGFGTEVSLEEVLAHAKDVVWQYQNGIGGTVDLWIDNVELFR